MKKFVIYILLLLIAPCSFAADEVYETLYLYLLGCNTNTGEAKNQLLTLIKNENIFKSRLEKTTTKTAYESKLFLVNEDIKMLNIKKSNLKINTDFEKDLENLKDRNVELQT